MELAPVSTTLSFEVTYDRPDLNVAMLVYDTTPTVPVLISGPTAMPHLVANTYSGKFTPPETKQYVIVKAVYTDDTFETLDPDYSQGSESIIAQDVGGGGSSTACALIGIIDNTVTVVGLVNC